MKDNVLKVMGMIDGLEALMTKHISNTDSFKAKTVKHQVNTKTEYSKILSDIERLNKQHENMNKVLVKNQEEVTTLKSQLAETFNKLNKKQSTTEFMAKVDEISGQFRSLDGKVNQLQSNILEMKVMRSPPPLQPSISYLPLM